MFVMWRDPLVSPVPSTDEIATIQLFNGASNPGVLHRIESAFNRRYEVIYSETGLRQEHPCQHYCVGRAISPGPWSFIGSDFWSTFTFSKAYRLYTQVAKGFAYGKFYGNIDGRGPYGSFLDPITGIPILYQDYTLQSGGVQSPVGYTDLKGHALNSMLPGIRPRLSLINSIIELKDFKSLASSCLRAVRSLRTVESALAETARYRQLLAASLRRARKEPLREILRRSSNGWLQYSFAWAPLVSDIIAVKRSIYETRKQIQNLLERERLPQKHYYRYYLSEQYEDKDESVVVNHSAYHPDAQTVVGNCRYFRTVSHTSRVFQGTIHYSYELDGWAKQHAAMNGYLDALGVQVNPSVIWNAIPWTFVVDWVTGVSSWLSQFRRSNLEPKTHITGCTFSWEIDRVIQTAFQPNYMCPNGYSGGVIPVSDVHEIAYRRERMSAADYTRSFELSGLNSREFSLAAALAYSHHSR